MRKSFFDPVDPKVNFPILEEKILKFWQKNKIFEKSLKKNKSGKKFVFYEGPPTANGRPGVHHVEARVFKDLIPRYKTMQGFYCERRAGWDCHGLPVEIEVEKQLEISGKPQIEKYGINKFNQLCRASVFKYVEEWERMSKRIGFWIDTKNAYETMSNAYIETCWWILKEIWEKGLLYEDYKVVPYCTRCGTSLSSHELALGYKDNVSDPSIFIKFKVKGKNNTYLVAWTTTPWTLLGNVALAVDASATYVEVKVDKENLIFADRRVEAVGIKGEIVNKYKGKELVNWEYEPLYDFVKYEKKAYYVVPADFVSMEEGTGIVHTAVMYGEDDFELGKKFDLPREHLVNEKGEFISEVGKWQGKFVKKFDLEIIEDLIERNILLRQEKILHTYPFCWRCGSPLLYYALTSWFLKTTAVKENLIRNNNEVNWIPAHIKEGRMGEWLLGNRDWALTRSRYWGTPFPVWKCTKCDKVTVIGGVKELSNLSGKDLSKIDLHKPFIDEIKLKCECGGEAKRLNFVIDCWFDSGSMPFGQWHYPFENKKEFDKNFPADFISEAVDQTRGWFYTLQAVSTLLGKGTPYKNVICLGHVLDEKGNKMSKSKGNVVDPWAVINDVGTDAMRWYFYSVISPGNSFRFSPNLVKDVNRRFLLTLWNVYNFFVSYASIDGWSPGGISTKNLSTLDRWVLLKINQLTIDVTAYIDSYQIYNAALGIEDFTQNFSTWYIRRSRERVGPAGENNDDKSAFYETSHKVLVILSKLMAPFAPFIADTIYINLTKEESVHLADWPQSEGLNDKDKELIVQMEQVREIVERVHAARKEAKIPVQQPLSDVTIYCPDEIKLDPGVLEIAKEELNIKVLIFLKGKEKVELNTKITPELEDEAKVRELVRKVQEERKSMGLNLTQIIDVQNNWLPKNKKYTQWLKNKAQIRNMSIGSFKVERAS